MNPETVHSPHPDSWSFRTRWRSGRHLLRHLLRHLPRHLPRHHPRRHRRGAAWRYPGKCPKPKFEEDSGPAGLERAELGRHAHLLDLSSLVGLRLSSHSLLGLGHERRQEFRDYDFTGLSGVRLSTALQMPALVLTLD